MSQSEKSRLKTLVTQLLAKEERLLHCIDTHITAGNRAAEHQERLKLEQVRVQRIQADKKLVALCGGVRARGAGYRQGSTPSPIDRLRDKAVDAGSRD